MVLPRDLDRVAQGQMGSTQKVAPAMGILWKFNLLKHFLGRERFWRGNFFLQNRSPPDFADGLEMQNRLPVVGNWKVSERSGIRTIFMEFLRSYWRCWKTTPNDGESIFGHHRFLEFRFSGIETSRSWATRAREGHPPNFRHSIWQAF